MDDFPGNFKIDEIEKHIISEIEERTKLKLKKGEFSLNLKLNQDRIIGKVYLFGEYYDNFWVLLPNDNIFEKVCEYIFLTLENFGELESILMSSKRHFLENEISETTSKIITLINSKKDVKKQLGEIIIMVDERYPYEEFYENNFPVLQYIIRDTTQKLNIVERLNFDLDNFDEFQILNRVEKELSKLLGNE